MKKHPRRRAPHPAHHLFGTTGIVMVTLLSLTLLGGAAFYAQTVLRSSGMAAVISAVLVDLANTDRADADLGSLTMNPTLVAAAQAKADDMAANGYFAHTAPDGKDSWYWFKQAGYAFSYAGENLAVDFNDSKDVERAWMDSPTHRANIMNGKFTEVGIATAVGTYKGHTTTFVVQMFGTPANASEKIAAVTPVTSPEKPEDIAVATTRVLGSSVEETPAVAASAVVPEAVPTEVPVTHLEESEPVAYAPAWGVLATAPHTLLRIVYALSALILIFALALVTRLELRKHHLRHMAAATLLIVFIGGLAVVADQLLFATPVVGQVPLDTHA